MVLWWVAGGDARGAVGVGRTANSACAGPGWYDGQECKAADLLQTQEERGRVGAAQVAAAGQCNGCSRSQTQPAVLPHPASVLACLRPKGRPQEMRVVAVAAWWVARGTGQRRRGCTPA